MIKHNLSPFNQPEYPEGSAAELKNEIDQRIKMTKKKFPLQKLIERYKLSDIEQLIFMFVLSNSVDGQTTSEDEILPLLKNTNSSSYSKPLILSQQSTLLNEGLMLKHEDENFFLSTTEYEIAPDICALILNNEPKSYHDIIHDIIKYDNILSYQPPNISMSEIVLPSDKKHIILSALSRFKKGQVDYLQKWGVIEQGISDMNGPLSKDVNRLRILLYGPPGMGKTVLANAIAKSLNRPILYTDVSRIIAKWVGDSEKNASKMFQLYHRIVERSNTAPVMLFDEADQLISSRRDIKQSVDRMYNQIQSIFLESLEKFNGIFIATTNLLRNIDEAFSRRFDIKLDLSIPSFKLRRQLWDVLLPDKLPLSEDVNLITLADKYVFSGGQIRLVIKNAAVAAASRVKKKRKVFQDDLIKYAELEKRYSFDSNTKKHIGF